jgi:hypothetical protein
LFIDVVGTSPLASSYQEGFVLLGGGGVARAAAHKMASYQEILSHQPPQVLLRRFAFDVFGGLHDDAVDLLARLQGIVGQGSVSHEGLEWYSTFRRLSFAVARALDWQLVTRLPLGGDELANSSPTLHPNYKCSRHQALW